MSRPNARFSKPTMLPHPSKILGQKGANEKPVDMSFYNDLVDEEQIITGTRMEGDGGTGKSYNMLKALIARFGAPKVLVLAFSNMLKESTKLEYGVHAVTYHEFFGVRIDGERKKGLSLYGGDGTPVYDVVFFDEVFMCTIVFLEKIWEFAEEQREKMANGKPHIWWTGAGDPMQTSAIIQNEQVTLKLGKQETIDYIRSIFPRIIKLHINRRIEGETEENKQKLCSFQEAIKATIMDRERALLDCIEENGDSAKVMKEHVRKVLQLVEEHFPHAIFDKLEDVPNFDGNSSSNRDLINRGMCYYSDSADYLTNKFFNNNPRQNRIAGRCVNLSHKGITMKYWSGDSLTCKEMHNTKVFRADEKSNIGEAFTMHRMTTYTVKIYDEGKIQRNQKGKPEGADMRQIVLRSQGKSTTVEDGSVVEVGWREFLVSEEDVLTKFWYFNAATVHSFQGGKIGTPFIITDLWSCKHITAEWLNTAVFRTTRWSHVFFLRESMFTHTGKKREDISIARADKMIRSYKDQDKKAGRSWLPHQAYISVERMRRAWLEQGSMCGDCGMFMSWQVGDACVVTVDRIRCSQAHLEVNFNCLMCRRCNAAKGVSMV